MKDEIAALIAGCDTYEQVQAVVADWMDYYNKDRYQWDPVSYTHLDVYKRQASITLLVCAKFNKIKPLRYFTA